MLFNPGQIMITRNALDVVNHNNINTNTLLERYLNGDWGNTSSKPAYNELSDRDLNDLSIEKSFGRIVAKYDLNEHELMIITEHDRSLTTVMLTCDY